VGHCADGAIPAGGDQNIGFFYEVMYVGLGFGAVGGLAHGDIDPRRRCRPDRCHIAGDIAFGRGIGDDKRQATRNRCTRH
jgi:hypothetical protein